MAYLSRKLNLILYIVTFIIIKIDCATYSVTHVPCDQGITCPQGNPIIFNRTFALNGVISHTVNLNLNEQLIFNLNTNVSIHPLTICRNPGPPGFCQGATGNDLLNAPITQAGQTTSATFSNVGTYYYGCHNHQGMGGIINVQSNVAGD